MNQTSDISVGWLSHTRIVLYIFSIHNVFVFYACIFSMRNKIHRALQFSLCFDFNTTADDDAAHRTKQCTLFYTIFFLSFISLSLYVCLCLCLSYALYNSCIHRVVPIEIDVRCWWGKSPHRKCLFSIWLNILMHCKARVASLDAVAQWKSVRFAATQQPLTVAVCA